MAAYKPTIGSPFAGSAGGLTFSHNKGGAYIRNRVIPVNPNSAFQQTVKAILAALATAWSNTLTEAQRQSWILYAANVPRPSKIGGTQFLTGLAMFIRSNVGLLQAGGTAVLDGPVLFDVGTYTAPTFTATVPATTVSVFFDNTDAWANEDAALLILWGGRPQSVGVNFFKGPFRFMGSVQGNSVTPPTSPVVAALPFPVVAGQKLWCKANVVRADGRLSDPITIPALIV
jgi:hypothetical protein